MAAISNWFQLSFGSGEPALACCSPGMASA